MPGLRDEDKVDPIEAQLEAQMEMSNLRRQYRCMRNDRKTYTEETENTVRKQNKTIDALLKENEELEGMILVAGSRQNEMFDQGNVEKIVELLDREKQVQEELKQEKDAIACVEKQVANMRETINKQCKKMGGGQDVNHKKHVANLKLTRVLENRLDEMTKKFNDVLTNNYHLREHIGHIEGQKARFLDLSKRLQTEILEGKREIDRIVEIATSHFNARDEAQHRMASLRERAERDLAMYKAEIKDVMRVLKHDQKLRDFMTTKTEDRSSILEQELIARTLKKMEIQLGGLIQEATKYEVIFDQIKEATGIEDTNTLVESFIENEDKNFALFNYVNNMNTEIECLQDGIKYLKDEFELIRKEGVENDVRRKEILQEFEEKMVKVTEESTSVKKEYKVTKRLLELLKPKLESVFNSIKCDRTAITSLLGGSVTVDDNNMLQYLGIVEQKCNQLLQAKALQKVKTAIEEGRETPIDGLQGAGPQPAHANLSIAPPSIEEEGEQGWCANEAKPLTVEEVQALIVQGNLRGGNLKATGTAKCQGKRKRP